VTVTEDRDRETNVDGEEMHRVEQPMPIPNSMLDRPPTDYQRIVIESDNSDDQTSVRYLLALASAHLITDITTNIRPNYNTNAGTSTNPTTNPNTNDPTNAGDPHKRGQAAAAVGLETWSKGFFLLADHIMRLHDANELDLDTLNEASRACSECWMVAASWPAGMLGEQSRDVVRKIAAKLRSILDPNRTTYRGGLVYVP